MVWLAPRAAPGLQTPMQIETALLVCAKQGQHCFADKAVGKCRRT